MAQAVPGRPSALGGGLAAAFLAWPAPARRPPPAPAGFALPRALAAVAALARSPNDARSFGSAAASSGPASCVASPAMSRQDLAARKERGAPADRRRGKKHAAPPAREAPRCRSPADSRPMPTLSNNAGRRGLARPGDGRTGPPWPRSREIASIKGKRTWF
ncbi:hypothetical protein [Micromonospora sp. CPCC 206061]|uniref:hypothetical protein n=1 Tax=Micromonospora sp. CPCC 206061 TaxID=3122410 RepID=UPI002FF18432